MLLKSNKLRWIGGLVIIVVLLFLTVLVYQKFIASDYRTPKLGEFEPMLPVHMTNEIKPNYDLIVVGTDPEGIAAALSATRNGLDTLLVDGYDRDILGGLMTLGWLNTIDMNYKEEFLSLRILNRGIFYEWYEQVEGDSFDIHSAANTFNRMVSEESNLDLVMQARAFEPLIAVQGQSRAMEGLRITDAKGNVHEVHAYAVIDATQDGDIAAAAGVPYSFGREDLGQPEAKMAVTAVIRLTGVTQEVWRQISDRVDEEDAGRNLYGYNEMSIWGMNDMQNYVPVLHGDRLRMRGLNIGRQNDESMLINALQIFGVDPLDPASRAEAIQMAEEEAPHILAEMKRRYPEFSTLELDGIAPELYVRESRHIYGEYRLSMEDVLENRDHWDRIAFGSYPVDIQRTSPDDWGQVVSNPVQYAIPYRSIVPLDVDQLLVVGKAASFDSLPHGSARVIPVGMATGEAAGAAVKIAMERDLTVRELIDHPDAIEALQDRLNDQGMKLKAIKPMVLEFTEHAAYEIARPFIARGLITGGYNNDFRLDEPAVATTFVSILHQLRDEFASPYPAADTRQIYGQEAALKESLNSVSVTRILNSLFPEESLDSLNIGDPAAEDDQSFTVGQNLRLVHALLEKYGD